jgi:hypothetical protein
MFSAFSLSRRAAARAAFLLVSSGDLANAFIVSHFNAELVEWQQAVFLRSPSDIQNKD